MSINKKPIKPDSHLKQYQTICIVLQSLLKDSHSSNDRLLKLETELEDIKKLLIQQLKFQKELSEFETKLFRHNLET